MSQDQLPDLDPLLDLDADAPPEFKCPITMSIMKNPVIMPDGQTYEKEAIENALKVSPVSPLTRQPMDMSQAKINYALKSLIDKYIQDHKNEIEKEPEVIDPTQMAQNLQIGDQIPIAKIKEIQIDSFTAKYTTDSMLISIKPQEITGRLPVSIVAVIDISGSMSDNASIPVPGTENACFARIQLVQYSLKTIISILGESDSITLITFSDKARIEAECVFLNSDGKQRAMNVIDKLYPRGCTNIWDALDKGIDQALKEKIAIEKSGKEDSDIQRNTSILLFTDGEPNINPPMGIIPTLEDKYTEFSSHFTISTFGFGYDIDSDLMKQIAEIGNGIYGYCPDVTMVGTVFINYLSSLISMLSPLAILSVNGTDHQLNLYNGSSTNLMISLDNNQSPKDIQINLKLPLTNQTFLVSEIAPLKEDDQNEFNNFRDQKYRKKLIDMISDSTDGNYNSEEKRTKTIQLFESLKNEDNRSQFIKNLMIDLYNEDEKHGQIERAYRKEYFNKWGRNYLFSLLRFHYLEQCGNYKDLSLQLYGNDIFKKIRKIGNKIFMNLPIPVANKYQSLRKQAQRNAPQRSRPQASDSLFSIRRTTMRSFTTSTTVCFNGDALIDLWNGEKKKVANLQKGDRLSNGAKVICLVRCATKNGCSQAVRIGGALFTPYHPVRVNINGLKKWRFPIDVGCPQKVEIQWWYNMIIDRDNSPVVIGGVETVTLGHNIKEGVCYHPYFGSQKVVDAMKKYDHYEKGFLEFKDPPIAKRDPITNIVVECF
ncbi:hypothetical protein M9Y10_020520 [Tritrichomonas musculus]|uniref:von Willebrand factor type A domain containing protein n=1 Tax=Tritrichomonas musculus TaxID=1915356 RepID=A0ABR2HIN6_9EUKA